MIGIFGSSMEDLQHLIDQTDVKNTNKFGKAVVMEGILNGRAVLLVSTGYNKVNLGMATGFINDNYCVNSMIGVGNCGYMEDDGMNICDIAIGSSSVQYSVNSSAIGYPETVIPGVGLGEFFSSPKLTELAENTVNELGYNSLTGKVATGEQFIADDIERDLISDKFNSQFIDMECGAVAQNGFISNTPVVFVKGISNFAGDDAPMEYQQYADAANSRACDVVAAMVPNMPCTNDPQCDCPQVPCQVSELQDGLDGNSWSLQELQRALSQSGLANSLPLQELQRALSQSGLANLLPLQELQRAFCDTVKPSKIGPSCPINPCDCPNTVKPSKIGPSCPINPCDCPNTVKPSKIVPACPINPCDCPNTVKPSKIVPACPINPCDCHHHHHHDSDWPNLGNCQIDSKRFNELDSRQIKNVINNCTHVNLGVVNIDEPYVVPMCYEVDCKCPNRFKLLSKAYGKKINCLKNNNNVVLTFIDEDACNVRSVVALGKAMLNYSNNNKDMEITVDVCSMTGREYFK